MKLNNHAQRIVNLSILMGALFFISAQAFGGSLLVFVDSISKASPVSITSVPEPENQVEISSSGSNGLITNNDKQSPQLLNTDTLLTPKKKKRVISPQRAVLFSAVLPGLGQAYNRKYWKIPLFYGAGAGLYYWYNKTGKTINEAENIKVKVESGEGTYEYFGTSEVRIESSIKQNREYREKAVLYMAMVYIANIIDAMADAYFLQYDMSDDLNISVEPDVSSSYLQSDLNYGFKLSLNF